MSISNFITGERIIITSDSGHLLANSDTIYQIGQINKVNGAFMAVLLLNDKTVGAINTNNIKSI